jgi:hypothetical protein
MDIKKMIKDTIQKTLEVEKQRLINQAYGLPPFASLHPAPEDEMQPFNNEQHTVDSTAIVIDDEIKLLPAASEAKQ